MFVTRHKRGFTLIELMIVVAVTIILAATSVAYGGPYIARRQVESVAFGLVQDLRNVQETAILTRHVMRVRFRADSTHNEYEFETGPGGATTTRKLSSVAGFPIFITGDGTPGSSVYLLDTYRIPPAGEVTLFFDAFGVPGVDLSGTAIAGTGADIWIATRSGVKIRVHVSPVIGQTSMVWQ